MHPLLTHKMTIPALILSGSIGPLLFALVSQYGFGLHPCDMCIFQRIPYGIIMLTGLISLTSARLIPLCLKTAIGLWVIDALLAAYHSAIEWGWVESATGCTAGAPDENSIEALRAAIMQSPLVSCSDASFIFMGLSMANWNVLTCLCLAGFGLYLFNPRKSHHA